MQVKVLGEYGYDFALLGLSLSYNQDPAKMKKVALQLAPKDFGHNKFLEIIYLWLDVTAPLYWWKQADTYRLSTKHSQSTMHTILKRPLTQEDFEFPVPEVTLTRLNTLVSDGNFSAVVNELPSGFLQRRVWVMNYKCLRNIIVQRRRHKLPEWRFFISEVLRQVEHPELLPSLEGL